MPGVATEPGPIVIVIPPPYSVLICHVAWPKRCGGRPRPGISAHPSTVAAAPPSQGWTVTKQPEPIDTRPGSLTIVTSDAASAASTALPPASLTWRPPSAAASLGAATATARDVMNADAIAWARADYHVDRGE